MICTYLIFLVTLELDCLLNTSPYGIDIHLKMATLFLERSRILACMIGCNSSTRYSPRLQLCTTPIYAIRWGSQSGLSGARGARGRGKCDHRGGHRVTQFRSRFGKSHVIPSRPEVKASDSINTGIIPVFYRSTSILFDPRSTFSYVSTHFFWF